MENKHMKQLLPEKPRGFHVFPFAEAFRQIDSGNPEIRKVVLSFE
jgi:hypothetical protein